jgi:hypothetical protein
MATQLLFYESAVPVSAARHGKWSIEVGQDYSFSKKVNSVPLTAVEFPAAAAEYTIVFTGSDKAILPTVILGIRGEENLYVDAQGQWQAKYLPAFIRRYPFVFSSTDDGKTFMLCVDESFKGLHQNGQGQALFGSDNKPTPYIEGMLKFLQHYQAEFRRTQVFCSKLTELELLEPVQAQVSLKTGGQMSLTGLQAVSRQRLKALDPAKIAELAKTDELELIYLHLQSMRNFSAMGRRVSEALGLGPAPVPPTAPAAGEPDIAERKREPEKERQQAPRKR